MKNYILRDENAVYYECGFSCDNEIFLKFSNEAFFITDPRYTLAAKESVKEAEVVEADDIFKAAREIIRKSRVKKIFYNPKEWALEDFKKVFEKLSVYAYAKSNFSQKKRIIKTKEEISKIKKAVKLGEMAFFDFALFLQKEGENRSEKELFFEISAILSQKGERDLSFPPIVAINENAAKPHAEATKRLLKKGDLILVDAGLKYERYCSDRTRTAYFDGFINFEKEQRFKDRRIQKIYDTVLKAQESAIKAVKPGVKAYEIDKAAREVIEEEGFGKYFVHSTGHGVGLDIHELPVISFKDKNTVLKENMVFTIEPGIYLPGEFGVRIEDMVVVNESGCEVL